MPGIGTITLQSPDGTPGRTLQFTDLDKKILLNRV